MLKPTLVLIAPVSSVAGYGVHSRMIARALVKLDKWNLKIIPTKWGNTPTNVKTPEIEPFIVQQFEGQPDISIQITIPSEFQKIGKKSIGITALTEANLCPPNFLEGSNKVDLVIVPSNFTKDVLTQTRIEKRDNRTNQVMETLQFQKPLEVLFEGLDLEVYNKENVRKGSDIYKQLNSVKEDFCYLFVGHWLDGKLGHDRKDVGMLVKTFIDTFKHKGLNKRPALILKTSGAGFSHMEKDRILDKLDQIYKMVKDEGFNGKLPSIYLLNGDLDGTEMNTLYNHPKVKAMVNFSHGEGYNLSLSEFAATGKPIIASNYSGHLDFLNPEFCVLLPGQLIQIDGSAANEWIPKEGKWFAVNYQYASQVLSHVFENYEKHLEKSRKLPKYVRDNFSLDKMTERLGEIMEKHTADMPKQMTLKLPTLKKY